MITDKTTFRRAAKLVAEGKEKFSCVAVKRAGDYDPRAYDLKNHYANFMGFDPTVRAPFGKDKDDTSPEAQLARSLALLFYAEIV